MTAPAPRTAGRETPPVTEWAVATIPSDPAPGLAVDDEPDDDGGFPPPDDRDAPPADGAVLPADVVETSLEPADEDERWADEVPVDKPIPPVVVPATIVPPQRSEPVPPQRSGPDPQHPAPVSSPRPTASPEPAVRRPAAGGMQRYGEAVVRQLLGATFVREEPYETGTRFS